MGCQMISAHTWDAGPGDGLGRDCGGTVLCETNSTAHPIAGARGFQVRGKQEGGEDTKQLELSKTT